MWLGIGVAALAVVGGGGYLAYSSSRKSPAPPKKLSAPKSAPKSASKPKPKSKSKPKKYTRSEHPGARKGGGAHGTIRW